MTALKTTKCDRQLYFHKIVLIYLTLTFSKVFIITTACIYVMYRTLQIGMKYIVILVGALEYNKCFIDLAVQLVSGLQDIDHNH